MRPPLNPSICRGQTVAQKILPWKPALPPLLLYTVRVHCSLQASTRRRTLSSLSFTLPKKRFSDYSSPLVFRIFESLKMSVRHALDTMWMRRTQSMVIDTTDPQGPQTSAPPSQSTKKPSQSTKKATVGTDTSPQDVFIAVMGSTGSGKSTLISKLAGDQVQIGHGLASCRLLFASTCVED